MNVRSVLGMTAVLALASTGCSEPVPPASKGAFYLSFLSNGGDCKVAGHQSQVGGVTAKERQDLKTDTVKGAQIYCGVFDNGGTFDIEGSIRLEDRSLGLSIRGLSAGSTEAAPASGSLNYSSSETGGSSFSSKSCTFFFREQEGVAAGRFWADFRCDNFVGGPSTCAVNFGTVALENCEQ
jgi:hypothetical protein